MFVARSLHRRSWKTLSSLLPANSSKSCVLFDGNSENAIKMELLRIDSILAPSKQPFNYLIGSRSMSSVRGRSMRSRVEKRMQKESGRTLTEIRRAKTLRKKLMTEEERLIFNLRRVRPPLNSFSHISSWHPSPESDSGTEDILSDLEDAMWKSDSEQEQEPVRLEVGNYEYRSDNDDDVEGDANETKRDKYRKSRQPEEHRGRGKRSDRIEINPHSFKDTNRKPRRAKNSHREDNVAGDLWRTPKQYDNSAGNSSDSDIAMWESDDQEDLKVPKEAIHSHQSTREVNERLKGDEKASKEKTTRKQADEAWESD